MPFTQIHQLLTLPHLLIILSLYVDVYKNICVYKCVYT